MATTSTSAVSGGGQGIGERLGFGGWARRWAAGLEGVSPPPGGVRLPEPSEAAELLGRLGVSAEDAADVVSSLPATETEPDWWWLLERSAGRLVSTMGDPASDRGEWPDWVGSQRLERRCFFAHVFLATMPFTLAWHRSHGVPEAVSWDSLADLGRHMTIHRRIHGSTGVDNAWWVTLCLRGEVFDLGRLQFNRFDLGSGDSSPPWYPWDEADLRGSGWRKGDACVGVHIPASGSLTPAACDESFGRAREFFSELFPLPAGQHRRLATCFSWLLDDQLADWLPEDSNIVAFQQRFELLPAFGDGDRSVMEFVFRRVMPFGAVIDDAFLASLPQRTRLERAAVAHLRAGGHWRARTGWVEL